MPQPGPTVPDSGFNEQRVLDELEQLQLAIRATRDKRERVQADFDAHLRAFEPLALRQTPPASVPGASGSAPRGVDPGHPRGLRGAADHSVPVIEERPQDVAAPAPVNAPAPTAHAPGPRRSRPALLAALAAAVAVAAFSVVWIVNRSPGAAQPPAAQHQSAPPQVVAGPQGPATPRPVPPVDPHPLRIDLTTLRRVWLRVAVDGRIALEREVAGGEQLPFGADHSIVVRAGDAGAVTVRVAGVDQGPIGRDGQVLTRTFPEPVR